MYSQFFGFDKLPFRLRPDADFLYLGREYLRARSGLIAVLRGSPRVVVLMGSPGVGKTLLIDDVVRELEPQFALCRINQPHISTGELLEALKLQLEVPMAAAELNGSSITDDASAALEPVGRHPGPALLIIDDAQLLPTRTLHALGRILARTSRLKVLLVAREDARQGAADLTARLNMGETPQFIHLEVLTAEGVKTYIDDRLRLAGAGGRDLFMPDAVALIHQHTAGSPRLINVLCDAALCTACLRTSGHIGAQEIVLATQDPRWPEALARDTAAIVIDETITDQAAALAATAVLPSAATVLPSAHTVVPNAPTVLPGASAVAPAVPDPVELPTASAQFIISYRDSPVQTWPLPPGRVSIGRAADNVLRLNAPDVSRHHCEVIISADGLVLADLGSVNGVKVNGTAVKRHVLEPEDVVRLGEHVLKFVVDGSVRGDRAQGR